jgi:hypothetical protein
MLTMFLVVLALALFFLSAIGVPDHPRFRLTAAGLFCWLLSTIIGKF